MNLYELTAELQQLKAMMEDDIDEQVLADTLEGMEGAFEDKCDGYARILAELNASTAALKAEETRLKTRREILERNCEALKRSLYGAMKATGKEKFKTALFSFGIRKNPPKVVLDGVVPDMYLEPQPPKVKTAEIRDALKAGEVLAFAHLEQGESLSIR